MSDEPNAQPAREPTLTSLLASIVRENRPAAALVTEGLVYCCPSVCHKTVGATLGNAVAAQKR